MTQALFIVDVQNDFTEEGALAVVGGTAVAAGINDFLAHKKNRYSLVFGSRDWHNGDDDNGGHFARDTAPDFVTTWPVHCVAGTPGADYHPELDPSRIDVHLHKGMGIPAYSLFEGVTVPDGLNAADLLAEGGITHVDIAGLATDYCVLASAKDALSAGLTVRVLTDLIAGVAPASSDAALIELQTLGAELITSATV